MRGGLGFLTLLIVLAVLKAALSVIVVAIGLALAVSFVTRPRETFALVVVVSSFNIAQAHPVPFIIALVIMIAAGCLAWGMGEAARRRDRKRRRAVSARVGRR